MRIKKFIKLNIALLLISFSSCSKPENVEVGIKGHLQDEAGNPLTEVTVAYHQVTLSTQTDSTGNFIIDEPRTLVLEFKKAGYQTLTTKIDHFSQEASYDFKNITLRKVSHPPVNEQDLSLKTDSKFKNLRWSGQVSDVFQKPIQNVRISFADSITESNSTNETGDFYFKIFNNAIAIQKEGFKEIVIDLPYYETGIQKITLLDYPFKTGIYLIQSGKYIPLPQTKLTLKSEEKTGHVLWGGNFAYNVTDFYYPKNAKEFKVENDALLRFIIFDTLVSSKLFEAQNNGYLCTANYKLSTSPSPDAEREVVSATEIYPLKYSTEAYDTPRIIEFKPASKNLNYAFVNSENKKGYYFSY